MKIYALILGLFFTEIVTAQNTGFVGSYWHTEMEYAEQMHILKSHRFSWQAVYGAVNQDIRGKWMLKNDTIHLILDPVPGTKKPEEILATLMDSGDLKLVKFGKKTTSKKSVLKRFDKTLPEEKAAEFAKPNDYSAQIEKRKAAQKKRVEKRQNESEKYGKYHGYFASDNEINPTVLALNAKRKQFIFKQPSQAEKEDDRYFGGTFTVQKDTAYLTTNSEADEIQVYGRKNKEEEQGENDGESSKF